MKALSDDQISKAKEPDQRGRQKITPSENYENIFKRARDSFRDLKEIAEILEDIEKHAHRFENARKIIGLFGPEKFEPILKAVFPTREQEGAPIDDRTVFEETKINVEKAIFASTVLKFSGDYLLQAFPQQEYPNLHLRISELNNDLRGMIDAFNRTEELKRQLHEYKKHFEYFEPVGLGVHDSVYDISCLYCRSTAIGKTLKEVSENIEHTPECRAEKEYDEKNPYQWDRWYKINPPSKLLLSLEERKKFDELLNKDKSKSK